MHDKTDPYFKLFLLLATIYFVLHGIMAIFEGAITL